MSVPCVICHGGNQTTLTGASIDALGILVWFFQIGGLGLACMFFCEWLWKIWAKFQPLKPLTKGWKRGISILVPIVIVTVWYLIAVITGQDSLSWAFWFDYFKIGFVVATGQQISFAVYKALTGEAPPEGKENLTFSDLMVLLKNADWKRIGENLPGVIQGFFPPTIEVTPTEHSTETKPT